MSFTIEDFHDSTERQDRTDEMLARISTVFLRDYLDRQAPGIFGRLLRRPRVMTCEAFMDMLDDAVDDGQLTWDDFEALRLTALVLTGQRPGDRIEICVLVDVSADISARHVKQAIERARALEKLGRPVIPAVAGDRIDEGTARLAYNRGVWVALGGSVRPPHDA